MKFESSARLGFQVWISVRNLKELFLIKSEIIMEEWNLDILLKYSIFFTLEMRNALIRPWPFFTKYVLHETGGYGSGLFKTLN